ncbi:hypothetical protein [Myceligenerans xiligouense]|uniref:hypothetical protein n=1 Tax=Myceligenerans xiligouense TaxID=253184 RepID=UPI000F500E02|nr:hypothetical protein [Myceligenerans xiligouense]
MAGIGGAAQALPPAQATTSAQAGSAAATEPSTTPAEVTVEWVNQGAYGGGVEGQTPDDASWFEPLTVTVGPAGAAGNVHFVATSGTTEIDLGMQPVVDGEAVAPTWVLPGGEVVGDTAYAEWYEISAEFVPDDPSEFQGSVPERPAFPWVQFGNLAG